MDIKILKTAIAQNNIPKLMIFIGEEQALCKQYIEKIYKTLNKYYKYYDTADEVLVETSTNFREDFLYIIFNDAKVIKNPNYIEELIKTDRNIILYFTSFDKKCDLYKKYKDFCVSFDKIDKYSIVVYLLKKLSDCNITVAQDKVEKLVDLCGCNLAYCLNELDKIKVLGQETSNNLIDFMFKNGFPDYDSKINIFVVVQKFLNKDLSLLKDLLKMSESTIGLLTLIYKQAQTRLINSNNIENTLFYAKLMHYCTKLDCMIKDGTIGDKYAVDYLLLKIF